MMKTKSIFLYLIGLLALLPAGCSDEDAPVSTPPTLISEEAADITRTTATLSGSIQVATGTSIKEFGLEYSTVSAMPEENSTRVRLTYTASQQRYSVPLESLTPNTTYYYCFYATNGHNSVYSEKQSFTTKSDDVPTLDAVTVTEVTESSISLSSRFLDEGGSTIQSYGFAYRVAGSSTEEKQVQATDKNAEGRFTATLTGLDGGAMYEIRAYAINTRGSGYSTICTQATATPETPRLQMDTPIVETNSISLSASLLNAEALRVTEVGFYLSNEAHEEPSAEDSKYIAELNGNTFSFVITGLKQNTTYYVRAYAVNKSQVTGYSTLVAVTTPRFEIPSLSIVTPTDIQERSVTLSSQVTDLGGSDLTAVGFAYKTVAGTETQISVNLSDLTTDRTFTHILTGLTPGTTYQIRAYATNNAGTGYSEYVEFKTKDAVSPTLTASYDENGVTGNAIPVSAVINSTGNAGATILEAGFCWSTTNSQPTISDNKKIVTLEGATFATTLSGLRGETTYYIRAYATNESDTGYSDVLIVTTPGSNVPDPDDNPSPDYE